MKSMDEGSRSTERVPGWQMLLLWTGVLLGPIAWSVSLTSMFWFTHPVCQGASRGLLWTTGGICASIALVALIGTLLGLRHKHDESGHADLAPFMVRMGLGIAAICALVILLSLVPIALLSPCPL